MICKKGMSVTNGYLQSLIWEKFQAAEKSFFVGQIATIHGQNHSGNAFKVS